MPRPALECAVAAGGCGLCAKPGLAWFVPPKAISTTFDRDREKPRESRVEPAGLARTGRNLPAGIVTGRCGSSHAIDAAHAASTVVWPRIDHSRSGPKARWRMAVPRVLRSSAMRRMFGVSHRECVSGPA
jgi:hypothetical protein